MGDKAVIGLGNPGVRYHDTRHNVGFMVADRLMETFDCVYRPGGSLGLFGRIRIGDNTVWVAKPLTYMNHSGEFVGPFLEEHKIALDNSLLVYDDLDLSPGRLRFRRKGGSAGHRGVSSVIQVVGSHAISRLKIGIGHPDSPQRVIPHVLEPFSRDEAVVMEDVIGLSVEAIRVWTEYGIDKAMSEFNRANIARDLSDI